MRDSASVIASEVKLYRVWLLKWYMIKRRITR